MPGHEGVEISTYLGAKLKESRANVTVIVDDATHKVPFGTQLIEVPAGQHSISVYWGAQPRKARSTLEIDVPAGGVVRLRWDGPRWVWQTGRLSVQE